MWFRGQDSPFLTHHKREFQENGVTYTCIEQYLIATRAQTFEDAEAKTAIMEMDKPAAMKRVRVQNFNKQTWNDHEIEVLERALKLRYEQNEDLKELLKDTGPNGTKDKFWGCGVPINSPDITDPSKWPCRNMLGTSLMNIRNNLV